MDQLVCTRQHNEPDAGSFRNLAFSSIIKWYNSLTASKVGDQEHGTFETFAKSLNTFLLGEYIAGSMMEGPTTSTSKSR
jgi:hypothetical protein